jgi:Protein of unknown function (DUF1592)/Protein of unknown function (DUF1588)/Protein of unknown function (DUF1585)/Protein of unknown function (DUF1587)/Protein of unknown function (DUF1595)/Planctomycete cytochrome C
MLFVTVKSIKLKVPRIYNAAPSGVTIPPEVRSLPMYVQQLFILVACCCGLADFLSADDIQFERDVFPILQTHCIRCHGPEVQESNVRLDNLSVNLSEDRAATETWNEVLNVLQAGEMPPKDELPLSDQQRSTVTDWVSKSIKAVLAERQKTDGRVVLRRLNRVEYQNTMQDLLGMEMDYARDLPPDAMSADGFRNNGNSLQMSSLQLEYYLATARRALDRVIVQGDQPPAIHHAFTATSIDNWLGQAERSNRLGRRQEFLVKMVNDYPDDGDFRVRVQLTADIKPTTGYPLLEVSVGYQVDTEILMREFALAEITSSELQTVEFRGKLENFPLPVRGQGKFPGLVVRVRNVYDDGSPLPAGQKGEGDKMTYPSEDHLPSLSIQSVEFHGNDYEQWPPQSHRKILFEASGVDREDPAYIGQVLHQFLTRAFRRNVSEVEIGRFTAFYQEIRPEFPSFEEAIRETLAMVLIQPDFLFLLEPAGDEKRSVDEFEMASRLSYFLWSTMPDERLMELATAGTLRANLTGEVDRMLADSRAQRFVQQFTDQWLKLDQVDNVAVNRDRYPGFDDRLKQDMCAETHAMFAQLLRENLSATQLLSSDFTMLNEPLAKHYGIAGVFGRSFRRVPLSPELHRGGLLSHASVLLSNSTGADSHPVRRAVWIRDRLLNDPPAPPPPNVPSLAEANPDFHKLSVREQLEIHRTVESCNQCHRSLDPWGIALENFDAVGKWRTDVSRVAEEGTTTQTVNATVVLPESREVSGVDGLREYLVNARGREFARSLVSRLLTYALGRSLELTDQAAVDQVLDQFAQDDYRLKGLVHKVVASEPFQTK